MHHRYLCATTIYGFKLKWSSSIHGIQKSILISITNRVMGLDFETTKMFSKRAQWFNVDFGTEQ